MKATHRLTNLRISAIASVDYPDNPTASIVLFKRRKDMKNDTVSAEDIAKLPESVQKLIKDLTEKAEQDKDAEESRGLVAKIKALFIKDVPEPDEVIKDADPATQKAYAAMKKLAEGAEATAKQAVDKLERNEMIDIAKELKHLGKVDDVAGELMVLKRNADEKTWTAYLERQRGIAKQLKDSVLFKEMGVGDAGSEKGEDKLVVMAKAVQKAEPTLTYEAAYAKAILTPEGQTAYAEHAKKGDN